MNTEKTNEQLIALIQSGTDVQENMALLLEQNQGLVMMLAQKMPTSSVVDFNDLIQEGNIGLMRAVDSYDESKGAFSTYAGFYIKGTIMRNIEALLYDKRLPAHMIQAIGKYRQFLNEYKAENGEYPSDEEVLQHLDITKTALKTLKRTVQEINSVSLYDDVPGTEDLTIGESVADPVEMADVVIENLYQNECGQILWKHLEDLGGMDAVVLVERFFENKTLQAIADKYNLTKQRIEQIEKRALGILQEQDELKSLINSDFDYASQGLKYTGFKAWKENMESSVERVFRIKEAWDANNQNRIEHLLKESSEELKELEAMKTRLLECEEEQRKQIEAIFQRQFDEIVPHILNLPKRTMQVFIMLYVDGLRGVDVVSELNISKSNVSMNKTLAISRINEALAV